MSSDLEAINVYMGSARAVTPAAVKLQDEWIKWFDNLSWYEKNMDSDIYDKVRNKRNAFNAANAVTEKQKEDAKEIAQRGMSTEEMQGKARRITSKGFQEDLIPSKYKWGAAGIALLAIGGAGAYLYVKGPTSILGLIKRDNPDKKDEPSWERAKEIIKSRWGEYEKPWGAVTKVYKNLTGER
jgi:hypothetical protein